MLLELESFKFRVRTTGLAVIITLINSLNIKKTMKFQMIHNNYFKERKINNNNKIKSGHINHHWNI